MGYFSSNIVVVPPGGSGATDIVGLSSVANAGLSAASLPGLIVRSMQQVGLKNIKRLSSVDTGVPGFGQLHTLSFKGTNPLRSSLFIPMSGYETYLPSQEKIARAYLFFGDLEYLYLLEFDGDEAEGDVRFGDHFFLGYNDQILAYRGK